MDMAFVMRLTRDVMWIGLLIAGPMLGVSLLVGLVVSLFQAMTQINEMTLTFVPKLIAIGLVLLFAGPWMLGHLVRFSVYLINLMPMMVR